MEDLIEKKLITDLKILIINIKNYKIIIFLSQQKKKLSSTPDVYGPAQEGYFQLLFEGPHAHLPFIRNKRI